MMFITSTRSSNSELKVKPRIVTIYNAAVYKRLLKTLLNDFELQNNMRQFGVAHGIKNSLVNQSHNFDLPIFSEFSLQ